MHPFLRGPAPLHISHRGGAALSPENTLLAFERAVAEFATDVIELDVQLTKDGELVVCHDPTVDRCTDGSGAVSSMLWTELRRLDAGFHFRDVGGQTWRGKGATIPRFVDVLRAFPAMRFNVEVKQANGVPAFSALMREERCLDRLCIGSEHDDVGAQLVEALPDALHFFPKNALAGFLLPVHAGETPVDDPRYTVIDMPLRWEGLPLFNAQVAQAAKALGKWVNVWTVDVADDMRTLRAQGVGGIMTDRPDVLRAVLNESAPS